jgi:glycosyltransferase involved in cell wall biosynthesis
MILFNALSVSSEGAGISRYTLNLARHLLSLYGNEYIKVAVREDLQHLFQGCNDDGLIVFRNIAPLNKSRRIAEGIKALSNIKTFSLVHNPHYKVPLLLPLLFMKPAVVTLHDIAFFRHPDIYRFRQRTKRKILTLLSVKKARRIICVSDFTKQEAIRLLGADNEKIRVIHSGLDWESFKRSAKNNHGVQSLTELNIKKPYLLCVGTSNPKKNLTKVLEAFHKMKLGGLKHKLVIVGKKGRVTESIYSEAKRLGLDEEVIFTGFVSDDALLVLYKNADVFIYIGFYEGFGFPPLEAMACGTPVVVSNTSSLPEIVGDAGVYVDPYSIEDMASGIYKILQSSNLRNYLVQKGFQRVRLYSWESTAKKTVEVYEEVLEEVNYTSKYNSSKSVF